MPDFIQSGPITTLHDLNAVAIEEIEQILENDTQTHHVGLVLPVTAADMRATPFAGIVEQLAKVHYIEHIAVVLGVARNEEDYRETVEKIRPLGEKARVLWTDGERIERLYTELHEAGLHLGSPGKGKSVWTAFGYLLSNPRLEVFALHDCDIVDYDRGIPARLCLPLVHSGLDFEFCKAYYARFTTQLHGRVVRLLVSPLLTALIKIVGENDFLGYLKNFRYPLSGEFAVTANLAKSNRIPCDWGLEVGTLAEVFRNTSLKRVCQVDLCARYEHKHQALSAEDPTKGLMKMATDIMTTIFRTLASMGIVLHGGHFVTLRSAYLRAAQDAIRQYHADALINGLILDRHAEEQAVEGFARQILVAGEIFTENPLGGEAIPNWNRVLAAFPNFPQRLWDAATEDAREFSP
jgi:glucosyl-3-phosphoglycerate synthase